MKDIQPTKIIDVSKDNITPIATFKEGNTGVLILELFKDGKEFDITGQTVTLGANRPNKTIVEQIDGFIKNKNLLTINLKNNVISIPGIVGLELNLEDSEGEMTTSNFYIKVNKKILGEDNINASDEISSLKQLKIDLTALNEKASREENTRVENEKLRKSAETERQDFYENTAKPTLESLKDYDSQITENTNQIDKAKVGFDGKEHTSLKHRIDAEYLEVKEQFNANSYVPFEGENVTVEHSLDGVTKDMELKGRTLQNVMPESFISPENMRSQPRFKPLIELGKVYTVIIKFDNRNDSESTVSITGDTNWSSVAFITVPVGISTIKKILNVNSSTINRNWFIELKKGTAALIAYSDVMILEGDWTNKEVPTYFEGIKSVGEEERKVEISSFGKNLLNLNQTFKSQNSKVEIKGDLTKEGLFKMSVTVIGEDGYYIPIFLEKDKTYTLKCEGISDNVVNIRVFKKDNFDYDSMIANSTTQATFTVINNSDFYNFRIWARNGLIELDKIQIVEGNTINKYESYQEDKKEILLNQPLRGLPNGVCDKIFEKDGKVLLAQNITLTIVNSNSLSGVGGSAPNQIETLWFQTKAYTNDEIPLAKINTSGICNKLKYSSGGRVWSEDEEGIVVVNQDGKTRIQGRIKRSSLQTQDIEGIQSWLQANPTTVYYQLAEPIITELPASAIDFKTYLERTHISSTNKMPPTLSFKAPVNVPATISTLRAKNESLQQENEKLKEEVDIKTLKLHGQDIELTNSDLDLDFRIFELEMSIGRPVNLNMKGMGSMARSPFEMMKILVLNNNYYREDIEYKAGRYLQGKRMTQAEYDEIISLMDANELVK